MSIVAPVVSEIFEKTGANVNKMFLQKKYFLSKIVENNKNILSYGDGIRVNFLLILG